MMPLVVMVRSKHSPYTSSGHSSSNHTTSRAVPKNESTPRSYDLKPIVDITEEADGQEGIEARPLIINDNYDEVVELFTAMWKDFE